MAQSKKPSSKPNRKNGLKAGTHPTTPVTKKVRKVRAKKTPEQLKIEREEKEARILKNIKAGFESGKIKTFRDIFDYLNKTAFGNLIGKQTNTFKTKLANPGLFTFDDVTLISNVTQVKLDIIQGFISNLVKNNPHPTSDRHRPLYI